MAPAGKAVYEFGPFRLDASERVLWREERPVLVTPKALETLLALVESAGHVVDKDTLLKRVWPDTFVEEATLAQNVFTLRKLLGETSEGRHYIETVPKRGYRFVATVKEGREGPGEVKEESQASSEAARSFKTGIRRGRAAWWPVSLALIVLLALIIYRWVPTRRHATTPSAAVRSIAVLPFQSIGGAKDEAPYLGLGMADALIIRLSNVEPIVVRPRNAVWKYDDPRLDPLVAGRELRVDWILDGTVERHGDRVRVTAQLLSVSSGRPVWADRFEDRSTDIFVLEDHLADRISQALMPELTGQEKQQLQKHQTANTAAFEDYVKGRYFWNERSEAGFTKAIQYFREAIALDPRYGQAYAGLADAFALLGSMPNAEFPRSNAMALARQAASKALELDGSLAEAHASLAFIRMHYDWDFVGAEKEFQRAIELNPGYATAHQWHAYNLMILGQLERGLSENQRALELDPASLIINADRAELLYYARRYDDAIIQSQETLEMDPNFAQALVFLGLARVEKRQYREALVALEQAAKVSGPRADSLADLGYAYARAGRAAEARKVLQELKEMSRKRYEVPVYMVSLYAALGEKDQAFAMLEQAYERRSGIMILLGLWPELDPLRRDPRFAALERRVGLP